MSSRGTKLSLFLKRKEILRIREDEFPRQSSLDPLDSPRERAAAQGELTYKVTNSGRKGLGSPAQWLAGRTEKRRFGTERFESDQKR